MKMAKAVSKLYKSYLFTVVAKEAAKLADLDLKKRAMKLVRDIDFDLDFDKKRMLRKIGLAPYAPGKAAMGTGMMLLLGVALGAVAGMVFAPARGEELRQNIKDRAAMWMGHNDLGETQAPAQA